jgi:autotransporter-associated beta strand protein
MRNPDHPALFRACRPAVLVACLALATEASAQLHSGDIQLSVPTPGGPIVTSGGEWEGEYAGRVFDEGVMPPLPPYVAGSPGFDSATGTFPAKSLIRFDFAKELLFWDGAALAPPTATMTVDYQDVRFAGITGNDTAGAPGFVITSVPTNGSFHEHLDYALPGDAAAGLYGIVLTLGPGGPTTAFTTSAPFLVTFARGSFSNYVAGLQAMVDVAFAPAGILIDVPSGTRTQAEAGYPTIASASSVTKTGPGTLVFDAANAYAGPTTIAGGTLRVTNADALAATAVTVGSGGQLSLPEAARVSVAVGGLTVDQASGGGRVDLGAGQLTIAAGGISAADLRADIIAGRNNGAWNGTTGITSSAAAATSGRAVGYVVNGDGSARVSFAASGDVDLNGQVNVFDLVSINSSGRYGTGTASVWSQGDFNYDGVTNVFDLVAVNTAGVYGQGNYFPAAPTAGGVAAVPEPGLPMAVTAGLATASAAGLIRSRRRRIPGRPESFCN